MNYLLRYSEMLKLIKLDLKQNKREYLNFYMVLLIIAFAIGFASPAIFSDQIDLLGVREYATSIPLIGYFITYSIGGIFTIAIIISVIVIYVRIFTCYKNNIFGRNAYLFMTLPVNSKQLLGSKIISAMIWLFICELAILFGLLILGLGLLLGLIVFQFSAFMNLLSYEYWNDFWGFIGEAIVAQLHYSFVENLGDTLIGTLTGIINSASSITLLFTLVSLCNSTYMINLKRSYRFAVYMIFCVAVIVLLSLYSMVDPDWVYIDLIAALLAVGGFFLTDWIINHKLEIQ